MNDKVLREDQVNYVPGIYCGLFGVLSYITLETTNWLYVLAFTALMAGLVIWNKGFFYFLKKYVRFSIVFIALVVNSIVSPLLALMYSEYPLAEFFFMMMIPVGAVAVFLFLMKTYTVERMKNDGWTIIEN